MAEISIRQAVEAARELNEPGEINAEYARGQANLICDLFGLLPGEEWFLPVFCVITHKTGVSEFVEMLPEVTS